MKAKFRFTRSTKNTHRYDEVVEDGKPSVSDALYIKKEVMPTPVAEIVVTVEPATP